MFVLRLDVGVYPERPKKNGHEPGCHCQACYDDIHKQLTLYRDLWLAAKEVVQGDPIQVVTALKAELVAAKATNKEDLAKLSEAVSLGAKQAEEFDALFDGVVQAREAAVAKADANQHLAEQWRDCAHKLYKIPHALECDRAVAQEAWGIFRRLSKAEPDATVLDLPAKHNHGIGVAAGAAITTSAGVLERQPGD